MLGVRGGGVSLVVVLGGGGGGVEGVLENGRSDAVDSGDYNAKAA